MEKIKILVIPSDKAGVGYYRAVNPHIKLQEKYPNDVHIDIKYNMGGPEIINWDDDNFLKKYQIIFTHRQFTDVTGKYKSLDIIRKLKSLNIVTVIDMDDHWILPKEHPLYYLTKVNQIHKTILPSLSECDYVTTTTEYFADKIARHNPNVEVFPNAIDPNENQFIPKNVESDKVRIGYIAGSSHLHDLKRLSPLFKNLSEKEEDKIQFALCGFDTRGTATDPNTKQTRALKPEESVWLLYEKIVTDDYKLLRNHPQLIKTHINVFEDKTFPKESPYIRYWTKHIKNYATHYNNIDISLAPLFDNEFNRCKSQLKVIEAGFFKKVFVGEKMTPYTIDIKDGVNGFLVDGNKNSGDWYKKIKKLINSKELREDMSEALYQTVKDEYNIYNVADERYQFYKEAVYNKNRH